MSSAKINIEVDYCEGCGFGPHFEEMVAELEEEFVDQLDIKGFDSGKRGAFEIFINGKLVFSKLSRFGFPRPDDVKAQVKLVIEGKEPEEITESLNPGCIIC